MKILIISLPRTGSSSLLFKLAKENGLKPIFEPFHDGTNEFYDGKTKWIYNENEDNIIVKTIIYHHQNNIELISNFDKIILLTRKDLIACAESFVFFSKNRRNGFMSWFPYFYENVSEEELNESIEILKKYDDELKSIGQSLKIPITYYEDIFDINGEDRLRKFDKTKLNKNKII